MIVNATPNDMQYFTSEQLGAPQMMGRSNGDMLEVLDACLITGWGEKQAQSVSLADNVITLDFGVTHGFLERQKLVITGFTDGSLDGVYRANIITPNSIAIKAPSALSAEGVVKAKIAPIGWESIFGKTSALQRAYRSLSPKTDNKVIFLDMSYPNMSMYNSTHPTKRAMVTVCQDMQVLGVPINDLTANINMKGSRPNGSLFWYQKRGNTSSSSGDTATSDLPSKWKVIGNSDVFYLIVGWSGYMSFDNSLACDAYGFGRFSDITGGAEYDTFLSASFRSNDDKVSGFHVGEQGSGAGVTVYTFSLAGLSVPLERRVFFGAASASGAIVPYPNKYGDNVFSTPYRIYEGREIRGFLQGMLFLDSSVNPTTYDGTIIGNLLMVALQNTTDKSPSLSCVAFYIGD